MTEGTDESSYAGTELDVFALARCWKAYLRAEIGRFARGRVLEVGAGIGSTTRALRAIDHDAWTCLEPDPELARRLREGLKELAPRPRVVEGTLADLPAGERFDTLLYVDVLEHIEDDRGELAAAASRLAPGGALVILAPAHPWLFTPFDAAIGHHRRYTRRSLAEAGPAGLPIERSVYLDSVGLLASAANRWLLRSAQPTATQVVFWDRAMIPLSRVLDPILARRVGKSVLVVWRAP